MTEIAITGAAAVVDDELAQVPEVVRARAARVERVTQLALAAAARALADAALVTMEGPPRPRLGVVLGTTFGCFLTNAAYQRRLVADGARAASPRLFAATVSNAAAGEVGIAFRLGGPAVTLTAGGAAGLLAIAHAADLVATGRADAMVAGGMDASDAALARWLADGGMAMGEAAPRDGAGILVLEPVQAARRRGVPERGRILGHAAGFTPARDAEAAAVRAAIASALEDAGVRPADLSLVIVRDAPRTADRTRRALQAVFDGTLPRVQHPAAAYGETFAAAGPLALVAALADAGAPAPFLVLDVCPSGHVGALVAAAGAGRA